MHATCTVLHQDAGQWSPFRDLQMLPLGGFWSELLRFPVVFVECFGLQCLFACLLEGLFFWFYIIITILGVLGTTLM